MYECLYINLSAFVNAIIPLVQSLKGISSKYHFSVIYKPFNIILEKSVSNIYKRESSGRRF
jgi:hypothetical protein